MSRRLPRRGAGVVLHARPLRLDENPSGPSWGECAVHSQSGGRTRVDPPTILLFSPGASLSGPDGHPSSSSTSPVALPHTRFSALSRALPHSFTTTLLRRPLFCVACLVPVIRSIQSKPLPPQPPHQPPPGAFLAESIIAYTSPTDHHCVRVAHPKP